MQAENSDSIGGAGDAATNLNRNIRFRPKGWVQRWVANGNEVEALSDGHFYLGYDFRPDRAERADERARLQQEVRPYWRSVWSYMVRTGQSRVGAMA